MNYSMIRYILAWVFTFEGMFLMLPAIVGGIYGEKQGLVYLAVAAGCLLVGTLGRIRKIRSKVFYSKEGFAAVSLSWIIMSLVGALPFFITGDIPAYEDALFETISGFTTTGATILNKIESIPKSILFWRSFTHWIGGMGILCFLIAVVPKSNSNSMYVMKAEVPGPTAGKVTPKISEVHDHFILFIP